MSKMEVMQLTEAQLSALGMFKETYNQLVASKHAYITGDHSDFMYYEFEELITTFRELDLPCVSFLTRYSDIDNIRVLECMLECPTEEEYENDADYLSAYNQWHDAEYSRIEDELNEFIAQYEARLEYFCNLYF